MKDSSNELQNHLLPLPDKKDNVINEFSQNSKKSNSHITNIIIIINGKKGFFVKL